ncbi:longitudinals lacking protein-like isoform X3 [Cydia pomonella]|uniref:longitudinals lacking protein-like isoform X3 n=1 Tax=Cydia pomonella TaxID=82600 RepID=UPI002ADE0D04|nr:longitudinals lacking protein-like isoform X3 [Cydia pomonella]
MDDDQQFCLRWNNHQSTLVSVFDTLLEKGIHVDCTLAAEGQTLKAHKVVLSACSPYFENVLSQQYDKHPIIILKDVKYAELRAMMDYMYRGEVNISQDQLAALLKAAESLQIKGLSDNKPSRPPSRPAQAAPAHPPRAPSPPPQVRDGSIDSREGSISPTRRRKKARRMSVEVPAPVPQPAEVHGNGEETPCKEENARDGVEDLTLDEEAEEPPAVAHNDVVRNFQWHMERSQDEIMNSSDSVRDSQGLIMPNRVVTRSKKVVEEPPTATTFAVLKNVTSPNSLIMPEETKENKRQPAKQTPKPPTTPKAPKPEPEPKSEPKTSKKESRYNIFPRTDPPANLPCAQYKTEANKYKCPNCQRLYNARKNLVRHITLECRREPQYKCPYCAYSKHRRNELKKHLERKHPEHRPPRSPSPRREPAPAPAPLSAPIRVE